MHRVEHATAEPSVRFLLLAGAGIVVGVASTPDTRLALPHTVPIPTPCPVPHAGRV